MNTRPAECARSFHHSTPTGNLLSWGEALAICRAVARRYAACPQLAEDAAQEAIIRAWRAPNARFEIRDPYAWLATIARREVFRLRRRAAERAERALEETEELPANDDHFDEVEERDALRAAIAALPRCDRALLHLRYVEDLTQAAVAAKMNIPEGTAKVRLHRARARLRSLLEEQA